MSDTWAMKRLALLAWAPLPLLLGACAAFVPPKAGIPAELLNPAVTPETVQQTVCVPAYARSITPPETAMQQQVLNLARGAGLDVGLVPTYVLDRKLPVVLGGHPTHEANLQLIEAGGESGARRKQALERRLMLKVCRGEMGLREAQAAIYPDWAKAYALYVDEGSQR